MKLLLIPHDSTKPTTTEKKLSKEASRHSSKVDGLAEKKAFRAGGKKEAKGLRGSKANKEALDDIKRKLDECVTIEAFERQSSDMARAIASITVFKTQMKVFVKKILSEKNHELYKCDFGQKFASLPEESRSASAKRSKS